MKKILVLCLVLCFGCSFSQELNDFELECRNKADLVFKEIAESQSKNLPYLLFSSRNLFYLIIIDKETHYTRIKASLNQNGNINIESVKSINKSNEILKKAFDQTIYHVGFIGFQSEFYKNGYELASGATTYFVMKDKNRKRFGESSLSVIIKPNPINLKIYNYLITEILNE